MSYSLINVSNDIDTPRYLICYNNIPVLLPNIYLSRYNRLSTIVDYARTLNRFFNYFEDNYGISDFRDIVSPMAMHNYIESRMFYKKVKYKGKQIYLKTNEANISMATAKKELVTIQSFYLFLDGIYQSDAIEFDPEFIKKISDLKNKRKCKKTKYKSIWTINHINEISCIRNLLSQGKWKDSKKVRRTFTRNEISIIYDNLPTLRDKCIFLTCLETGSRVSEIINSRLVHFKQNEKGYWVIGISKSKTKPRFAYINEGLRKLISLYIVTDRKRTIEKGKKNPYIFLSTRGKTKGDKIGYGSYRRVLKQSARAGGLDEKDICTHMARATNATFLKSQGVSDTEILKVLGNKKELKSYVVFDNPDFVMPIGEPLYNIDFVDLGEKK